MSLDWWGRSMERKWAEPFELLHQMTPFNLALVSSICWLLHHVPCWFRTWLRKRIMGYWLHSVFTISIFPKETTLLTYICFFRHLTPFLNHTLTLPLLDFPHSDKVYCLLTLGSKDVALLTHEPAHILALPHPLSVVNHRLRLRLLWLCSSRVMSILLHFYFSWS